MKSLIFSLISVVLLQGCSTPKDAMTNFPRLKAKENKPPVAQAIPYTAEYHGLTLNDPYHWLKDQSYPEIDDKPVLDYLNQENQYFADFIEPHEPLVESIFEEFKGRINEADESVPWEKNGYRFRWEFSKGAEYRTWIRQKIGEQEEVFLNEAELAKGHEFFDLGDYSISRDNQWLAYSVDTDGDERYDVHLKNLITQELRENVLEGVSSQIEFGADNQSLIYGALSTEKWRVESINLHHFGAEQQSDKKLLEELDEQFFLGFGYTSSEQYLLISSSTRETNETYVINAQQLDQPAQLFASREAGFSYSVDHAQDKFYILANDTHKNFRLAITDEDKPGYDNWQTKVEGSDDVYRLDIQTFNDFMVIKERHQGLDQIKIWPYNDEAFYVDFPEQSYAAYISNNPEFNQQHVRLYYESLVTPDSTFDYQIASGELVTRKVQNIPSGYDPSLYVTERLMAPARDGVLVPVSIVYKKEFKRNASHPLVMTGYGAYGNGYSPSFSTLRLSLLDRGFAYAIAHVRGGDEMGYQWYLDGKLDKRMNTFNDFVDVASFLVEQKYVAKGNISITGRSAGGELMGAAVIQAPELWRSVILGVPFVDVLNTILDDSLPLTPPEWQEWGNPIESKHYYELLQSYSPYDNIKEREYPPMMVTGGLNDPRVTYWEPAKWTAKMRATKTDDNLMVMRINMGAGHFANSGRYGRLKDFAQEFAFILLAHEIQ